MSPTRIDQTRSYFNIITSAVNAQNGKIFRPLELYEDVFKYIFEVCFAQIRTFGKLIEYNSYAVCDEKVCTQQYQINEVYKRIPFYIDYQNQILYIN